MNTKPSSKNSFLVCLHSNQYVFMKIKHWLMMGVCSDIQFLLRWFIEFPFNFIEMPFLLHQDEY